MNLCAVTPDESGALVIHSHNGGNIHGQEAVTLMNDLLADPTFAAMQRRTRGWRSPLPIPSAMWA